MFDCSQHLLEAGPIGATDVVVVVAVLRFHAGAFAAVSTVIALMKRARNACEAERAEVRPSRVYGVGTAAVTRFNCPSDVAKMFQGPPARRLKLDEVHTCAIEGMKGSETTTRHRAEDGATPTTRLASSPTTCGA